MWHVARNSVPREPETIRRSEIAATFLCINQRFPKAAGESPQGYVPAKVARFLLSRVIAIALIILIILVPE